MPRILLIGQAPGPRGAVDARPFAGPSGEKLRAWFEAGGIPREDFWRKIHFAAVTRCYPGRLPGARGDRLPSPAEQALCRPWLDELVDLIRPEVVLLLGLLAIRTALGPVPSLSASSGPPGWSRASATSPCPTPRASAGGSTTRPTSRPWPGRWSSSGGGSRSWASDRADPTRVPGQSSSFRSR